MSRYSFAMISPSRYSFYRFTLFRSNCPLTPGWSLSASVDYRASFKVIGLSPTRLKSIVSSLFAIINGSSANLAGKLLANAIAALLVVLNDRIHPNEIVVT